MMLLKQITAPWNWIIVATIFLLIIVGWISLGHWDWVTIGAIATSAGIILSLYYNHKNLKIIEKEKQKEESQFLLLEIKQAFNNIIKDLQDGNNNYLIWHKSKRQLKTFLDLSDKLIKVHASLFSTYFDNFRFDLRDIIARVKKPTFFYGLSNKDITLEEAHDNVFSESESLRNGSTGIYSVTPSAEKACSVAIAPECLRYLIHCTDLNASKITEEKFSEQEKNLYSNTFPKAIEYLAFRDKPLNPTLDMEPTT